MKQISIIIPTYNEAKNLPLMVEEVFSVVDKNRFDVELIIVDDNSPDGTGEAADKLAEQYPLKVIHRAGKQGLGSAVRAGFAASDRDYLGVMDADLSHDPAILNDLLAALGPADIAMGSRFKDGSTIEGLTPIRKLIARSGMGLSRLITRTSDPLSGYFFLKKAVIKGVDLNCVGYKILLEILVKGRYDKVDEICYNFRMRRHSTSKLDAKEYARFLKQLLVYGWYVLFKK